MKAKCKGINLHSLIPIEDFKAILSVDDREDALTRFYLITATFTIEQYCMRRLLRKRHFERIEWMGDLVLPLREYPVISMSNEQLEMSNGEKIGAEYYRINPDCGTDIDIPFVIELSPSVKRYRNIEAFKAVYTAGYEPGKVPADLASACLELAAWNMNRYRGRRIGMAGNVRGSGRDGEHFELSMPENVKQLLEPYRRKVI